MTSSVAISKKKFVGLLFRIVLLYNSSWHYDLLLCKSNENSRVVYMRASLRLNTIRKLHVLRSGVGLCNIACNIFL